MTVTMMVAIEKCEIASGYIGSNLFNQGFNLNQYFHDQRKSRSDLQINTDTIYSFHIHSKFDEEVECFRKPLVTIVHSFHFSYEWFVVFSICFCLRCVLRILQVNQKTFPQNVVFPFIISIIEKIVSKLYSTVAKCFKSSMKFRN